MIEFQGEVSKELLPKIYKTEAGLDAFASILAFSILSIPLVLLGIFMHPIFLL